MTNPAGIDVSLEHKASHATTAALGRLLGRCRMSASHSRRAALEALSRDELIELALRVSPSEMPASGAGSSGSTSKPTKRQKEQRPFDMSRYAQRHVALRVAYIGTAYQGFAYQVETDDTVEGRVLEALMKTRLITDRASSGVSCGGRTDKGVSALGQVLALRVRSNLVDGEGVIAPPHAPPSAAAAPAAAAAPPTELDYCHLLNRVLPPDIRVTAWSPTDAQFSARFSATHRTYKYFFARAGLDVERMAEGARRLLGEHDFRNFCKIDPSVTNFRRSVLAAAIQPASGSGGGEHTDSPLALWEFEVRGTAFLYHQVRCMVAVLFLIGEGKEAPTIVSELLDTARYPRRPNYEIASEATRRRSSCMRSDTRIWCGEPRPPHSTRCTRSGAVSCRSSLCASPCCGPCMRASRLHTRGPAPPRSKNLPASEAEARRLMCRWR